MSAVSPILTVLSSFGAARYEARRRERREKARANVDRRRNLLEYESDRRAREAELRRTLSRLRADRAAAGLGRSLSLRAQEGGLLREFAREEGLERNRLGLRNERIGLRGEEDKSLIEYLGLT